MTADIYLVYGLMIVLLTISFMKNREKTFQGIKKGLKTFIKVIPIIFPLILFAGILLAVVTPELIGNVLGDHSGVIGYIISMILGSITFMSPFVAYPLGADLIANGASQALIAGFLVTLMGVSFIYFPMECKFFNKKAAIYRNVVAFIGAGLVVIIMLVIQ